MMAKSAVLACVVAILVLHSVTAAIRTQSDTDIEADSFLLVGSYYNRDILRVNLQSPSFEYASLHLEKIDRPTGVDFDSVERTVYWADQDYDTINRADLNGSDPEVIVSHNISYLWGLALDVMNRKIYWADFELHRIERANLDGTAREFIIADDMNCPYDIVVDSDGSFIYFTDCSPGKIEKANLDGSKRELLLSGLEYPYRLALDRNEYKLYWSDYYQIGVYDLEKRTHKVLISSDRPYTYGLAVIGDHIYWSHYYDPQLYRANKVTGAKIEEIGDPNYPNIFDIHYYEGNGNSELLMDGAKKKHSVEVGKFYRTYLKNDPCSEDTYTEINATFRSPQFSYLLWPNSTEPTCDDDLEEGWYRFVGDDGGDMPTSCVDLGMCGTDYPIWLAGQSEGYDNITIVQACINKGGEDCCDESVNISVKNCGNFTVYKLKQVVDCPVGYCAGQSEPCPQGQSSLTGFQPGCSPNAKSFTRYIIISVSLCVPFVLIAALVFYAVTKWMNKPEKAPPLSEDVEGTGGDDGGGVDDETANIGGGDASTAPAEDAATPLVS
ncbi:uncharacterized protein [Ptychodera flava]|uniref:uncharacterized protein n=1 Tax=Ptychodera flava TaxID=63121 RepID=UPI00396A4EDD